MDADQSADPRRHVADGALAHLRSRLRVGRLCTDLLSD